MSGMNSVNGHGHHQNLQRKNNAKSGEQSAPLSQNYQAPTNGQNGNTTQIGQTGDQLNLQYTNDPMQTNYPDQTPPQNPASTRVPPGLAKKSSAELPAGNPWQSILAQQEMPAPTNEPAANTETQQKIQLLAQSLSFMNNLLTALIKSKPADPTSPDTQQPGYTTVAKDPPPEPTVEKPAE